MRSEFMNMHGIRPVLLGCAGVLLSMVATAQNRDQTRIVAVGDLHGDLAALQSVLDAAELVDENNDWSGGATILIQTGDVSDRGPDTRRIISLLRELESEAEAAGGQVIVLSGNHEALNMIGDYRYVDEGEIEAFIDGNSEVRLEAYFQDNKEAIFTRLVEDGLGDENLTEDQARELFFERFPPGFDEYREAWSPEGIHGDWVDELPAVIILGDTLFVHGGMSAPFTNSATPTDTFHWLTDGSSPVQRTRRNPIDNTVRVGQGTLRFMQWILIAGIPMLILGTGSAVLFARRRR